MNKFSRVQLQTLLYSLLIQLMSHGRSFVVNLVRSLRITSSYPGDEIESLSSRVSVTVQGDLGELVYWILLMK